MLAAPDRLSPAARIVFDVVASQVANCKTGVPDALLTDLLTQYAEAHAMREMATRQLAADGSLLAVSPNGVRYVSPHLKVVDQCEKTMDRVFRRLGFGGKIDVPQFALELDND